MLGKNPELLFTATPPDLKKFVGKQIHIPRVGKVTIQTICGNLGLSMGTEKPRPQFYEINGQHLISMLRFHAYMEGAKDITEEEFLAFENMEVQAEKMPDKMKLTKDVKSETH